MDLTQPAEGFNSCKYNIAFIRFLIDSISIDAEDDLIHLISVIG
jgi:hypothetical protein